MVEPYRMLWAKTDKETGETHPLIFHLLDVGFCALELWERSLSPAGQRYFAGSLQCSVEEAGRFLAFLSALHDLGKASPAFQMKHLPSVPALQKAGFDFPDSRFYQPLPHGLVSTWSLQNLLPEWGLPPRSAMLLARAVGGHHGTWPTPGDILSPHKAKNLGSPVWAAARRDLFDEVAKIFQPPSVQLPSSRTELQVFLTVYSGFLTTADWLGSMQERFQFASTEFTLEEYAGISRHQAVEALQRTGWEGWRADGDLADFKTVFDFPPYEVQSCAIGQAAGLPPPALVIVEAPTGTGKTETALYLADCWQQAQGGRGIYIAMPTQATSNQMFDRTRQFLEKRYPQDLVNLQLAHGQAILSERLDQITLTEIGEDPQQGVFALTWFQPRKRTLLAPFGVGTVDQALLSVLQTRHFFVRLFGLAHKVVIFDEVHAYDTYMSELFWRLLTWLHLVGTSVIILSATLPEMARRKLAEAFYGQALDRLPQAVYPRLTLVSAESIEVSALPYREERRVRLAWVERDPQEIVELMREKLADGGCATIVCNTIHRAQEIYRALKESSIVDPEDCLLFHARFPLSWRMERENQVLERFKKGGNRPRKSILVATQVVEQSLDLDFDLLVSELAPLDLVIQRAGRLHRHSLNPRPPALQEATLVLLRPERAVAGKWTFGRDAYVYEPYILMRSLEALSGRDALTLPADSDELIGLVYGEGAVPPDFFTEGALNAARLKMEKEHEQAAAEARFRLVLLPEHEDLMGRTILGLEEDSTKVHQSLCALTRLADPSISLVCLHETSGGLVVSEPDDPSRTLDIQSKPGREMVRELLQHSVAVQNKTLVRYFSSLLPWRAWEDVAALQNTYPVIFKGGVYHLANLPYSLELNREYGLVIRKESE